MIPQLETLKKFILESLDKNLTKSMRTEIEIQFKNLTKRCDRMAFQIDHINKEKNIVKTLLTKNSMGFNRLLDEAKSRENELKSILSNVPLPIYIKNRDLTFKLINDSFSESFNIENISVSGKNIDELNLSSSFLKDLVEKEMEVMESEETLLNYEVISTDNDRIKYYQVNITNLFDIEDNAEGIICVLWDMTDIKLKEMELENAKVKAEAASMSKSRFLANMSHEIRTPMNAIIGLSQILMNTKLSEKQQDQISKINSSSLALLSIINDILDFSKIEAGKLELENIPFDLNKVFDTVLDFNSPKIISKNLDFNFVIDEKIKYGLKGDPLRIIQVLSNLVSNAVKFTNEGEVLVEVKVMEELENGKIKLQFDVTDSGIGMSKAQIKRLFQSFSQADDTTSRKYGGTGLGLAISKQLVELMQGEIWVTSEVDIGSTFSFTLLLEIDESNQFNRSFDIYDIRKILILSPKPATLKNYYSIYKSFNADPILEKEINKVDYSTLNDYELIIVDSKFESADLMSFLMKVEDYDIATKMYVLVDRTTINKMDGVKSNKITGLIHKPTTPSFLFDIVLSTKKVEDILDRINANKSNDVIAYQDNLDINCLIVDDNFINLEIASELLAAVNIKSVQASSGMEAIEKITTKDSKPFNFILMDLQMPGMDGIETTQQILKLEAYKSTPIIALTADAIVGVKEKCFAAGMKDFITKPIIRDEFYKKINYWTNAVKIDDGFDRKKSSNDTLIELQISKISQLDLEDALTRVSNNWTLLKNLLIGFYNNNKNTLKEINQLLMNGEVQRALLIIHNIKGSAGNIGAKAVHLSSKALEEALKSKEVIPYNEIYDKFSMDFSSFLDTVKRELLAETKTNDSKFDKVEFKSQLESIIDKFEQADFFVSDSVSELLNLGGVDLIEHKLEQIYKLALDFEYDRALELCKSTYDFLYN